MHLAHFCFFACKELARYYGDAKKERIALLNIRAAHELNMGRETFDRYERERHFELAESLYDRADHIEPLEETFFGKGMCELGGVSE
jgi:hypothetical protein